MPFEILEVFYRPSKLLTDSEKKTNEEIEQQKNNEIKQRDENKKIRAENIKLLAEAKKSNKNKYLADAEEIYKIKKALNKHEKN
jgi:hypothetical protein